MPRLCTAAQEPHQRPSPCGTMQAFASPLAVTVGNGRAPAALSSVRAHRFAAARPRRPALPLQKRAPPRMSVAEHTGKVLRSGINAAVEDYVKTGMNVCVGGGSTQAVASLVEALAALLDGEKVIDVAFVAESPRTKAALESHNMPSDLSVNFKRGIDLFIAVVEQVDADLNAVLDTDAVAADRHACEIADAVVLIALEDDLATYATGLLSIPVLLSTFLPEVGAESLCSPALVQMGARSVSLRKDSSNMADLYLGASPFIGSLEDDLKRLPAVQALGLLPASEKLTVVVATSDYQPYDKTSSLAAMAELGKDAKLNRLEGPEREALLARESGTWSLTRDGRDALESEFRFSSSKQAEAFVRHIHRVANACQHHPEISHCYNRVHVCLTTFAAHGITLMDISFARELSNVCNTLHGCNL